MPGDHRRVTTVVRPWFGRGTSNLARQCDPPADRADARGWWAAPRPNHALTCVVTGHYQFSYDVYLFSNTV